MATPRFTIEAQLSGPSGPWTDLGRDLRRAQDISIQRGIQGDGPTDRVASTGTCTFTLDNSHRNQWRMIGAYSPDHTNALVGWDIDTPIRARAGVETLFIGKVSEMIPESGQLMARSVAVTASDWLNDAAQAKLFGIPTQVNVTADSVISTIVADMDAQPPGGSSLETGLDVFDFALDNAEDESSTVLSELSRIADSGLSFIYETRMGVLVHETRVRRQVNSANALTFTGTYTSMNARRSKERTVERVKAIVHSRRSDDLATSVLFSLNDKTPIAPGQTVNLNGPYVDPTARASRVGGIDMVAPVATTDYTMNSSEDGTGTDLTANFTVVATYSSNSVAYAVTNNGTQSGFVTKLQARGRGLYDYETVVAEVGDGDKTITLDMPYQSSVLKGTNAATYVLANYGAVTTYPQPVTITGRPDPMASQTSVAWRVNRAMLLDISDRIGITDVMTGLSAPSGGGVERGYFINGVNITIAAGDIVTVSWTLAPGTTTRAWLLGVPGQSELGETTVLAFA